MSNLRERAASAMVKFDPNLVEPFVCVFSFLEKNRDLAQKKGRLEFGSEGYLMKCAQSFHVDRIPKPPRCPATTNDPMVAVILEDYFEIEKDASDDAVQMHNFAMGAENIIGNLLERYIANELEPKGWAWCSGSIVKAVDFVHKPEDGEWVALQVKNRDNSENSSSKAIREGTNILHWFRTFSRREGTNWENFPKAIDHDLSEEGFRSFVSDYLRALI